MSKFFISTNLSSVESCFDEDEQEKSNKLVALLKINDVNNIQQIDSSNIYLHFDKSNPDIEIDKYNDYLLYHSQTQLYKFDEKFSKKQFYNHPEIYKEVFCILIDNMIIDKFNAIKTIVFPNINPQLIGQIGFQFIDRGGIDIEQIKTILESKFNCEIEDLLARNEEYHLKKASHLNTNEDDTTNLSNWYKLEKALKVNNG